MVSDDDGNDTPAVPPDVGPEEEDGRASETDISLEQALLAPLDAILKAQLHSARSFLNLLLQLGYPHDDKNEGEPYHLQFRQRVEVDGEIHHQTIRVPALALVPIAPLAVSNAEFQLEMAVRKITRYTQMRGSAQGTDRHHRPWYLVDKPINIEGVIAAPDNRSEEAASSDRESSIKIGIKINSIPMPRGLDKLLTSLTEMGQISDVTPPPAEQGGTGAGPEPSGASDTGSTDNQ